MYEEPEQKIDYSKPVIDEQGNIQMRLITLMSHPDYSLDLAFNGKGKINPDNRNTELDQMSIVDLLVDAKSRLEEEIRSGGRYATNYAYAGFMCDVWSRALIADLVIDTHYNRADYIDDRRYYNGNVALTLREKRIKSNQSTSKPE